MTGRLPMQVQRTALVYKSWRNYSSLAVATFRREDWQDSSTQPHKVNYSLRLLSRYDRSPTRLLGQDIKVYPSQP